MDTAIVPKKREVPVGTLRSILNQAHITLRPGTHYRERSLTFAIVSTLRMLTAGIRLIMVIGPEVPG